MNTKLKLAFCLAAAVIASPAGAATVRDNGHALTCLSIAGYQRFVAAMRESAHSKDAAFAHAYADYIGDKEGCALAWNNGEVEVIRQVGAFTLVRLPGRPDSYLRTEDLQS